jgi:hypothetical protein
MSSIDQSSINQMISAINQSIVPQIVTIVISIVLSAAAGFFSAVYKSGKYIQIIEDLKERVAKNEEELKNQNKLLIECSIKIEERTSSASSFYTKRKSPVSLNDKGEELLKKSGADKFVLQNEQELIQKIKEQNPKTAFDVQEISKKVVESLANDERFNTFKDFVYKEGINLEPIFTVMSIYLRDIALPLLGFDYTQIDKTDPSQIS